MKDSTGLVDKDILCPICSGNTQAVKNITVKHFVKDTLVDKVHLVKYYICLNEDCDVVYFNENKENMFRNEDIKIPIWFKKEADPKYICYCNDVTEQQIINAVILEDAKNMKDIIRITGAMKSANCLVNNPLGKCCSPVVQETINKALKIKDEILKDI